MLNRNRVTRSFILILTTLSYGAAAASAQSFSPAPATDLIILAGSDFARAASPIQTDPGFVGTVAQGLTPRANLSVTLGHAFAHADRYSNRGKDTLAALAPIFGDEPTLSYTYQNLSIRNQDGFWHGHVSGNTISAGLMHNILVNQSGSRSVYLWPQLGLTILSTGTESYTAYQPTQHNVDVSSKLQNRVSGSISAGFVQRVSRRGSIRVQASYSKIATQPWRTSTTVGYGFSF